MTEPILDELKRRLRGFRRSEWESLAIEAGLGKTLPRKLVYGDRTNPNLRTIESLLAVLRRHERRS